MINDAKKRMEIADYFKFPVLSVSKEDVANAGFDTSNITADDMVNLASYMLDYILKSDYIDALYSSANELGFTFIQK